MTNVIEELAEDFERMHANGDVWVTAVAVTAKLRQAIAAMPAGGDVVNHPDLPDFSHDEWVIVRRYAKEKDLTVGQVARQGFKILQCAPHDRETQRRHQRACEVLREGLMDASAALVEVHSPFSGPCCRQAINRAESYLASADAILKGEA